MANTKKPSKAKINYYIDILIAVSFLIVAVSGLVLFFAPAGGYQGGRNPRYAREILGLSRLLWKDLHDWGGLAMLGGVLLHLVLHWKWIVCMTRNLFRKRSRAKARLESCPLES